jgi:hypothetical protein
VNLPAIINEYAGTQPADRLTAAFNDAWETRG